MDVWGDVLFVVYGLPPAIVLGMALMAKLVAGCWASALDGGGAWYRRCCSGRQFRSVCEVFGVDRLTPFLPSGK